MVIYVVCYDLSASLATRILVLDIGKETTGYVHSSPLLFYLSNLFVNLSCRLRDKLALMQPVGVCFKLVGRQDEDTMYLFPSLGATQVFCFLHFSFSFLFFLVYFTSYSYPRVGKFSYQHSRPLRHIKIPFRRTWRDSTIQASLYLRVLLPTARRDLCRVECIHLFYIYIYIFE